MGELSRVQSEASAPAAHDRLYPGPVPVDRGPPAHGRLYPDPVPADRHHHGRVHPLPAAELPAGLKSNPSGTSSEDSRKQTRGVIHDESN